MAGAGQVSDRRLDSALGSHASTPQSVAVILSLEYVRVSGVGASASLSTAVFDLCRWVMLFLDSVFQLEFSSGFSVSGLRFCVFCRTCNRCSLVFVVVGGHSVVRAFGGFFAVSRCAFFRVLPVVDGGVSSFSKRVLEVPRIATVQIAPMSKNTPLVSRFERDWFVRSSDFQDAAAMGRRLQIGGIIDLLRLVVRRHCYLLLLICKIWEEQLIFLWLLSIHTFELEFRADLVVWSEGRRAEVRRVEALVRDLARLLDPQQLGVQLARLASTLCH